MLEIQNYLEEVKKNPSFRNYWNAYKRIQKMQLEETRQTPIKIALLSSGTIDNLQIQLDIDCRIANLSPNILLGGFNQYHQEIMDSDSKLYLHGADLIFLHIQLESIFPEFFFERFGLLTTDEKEGEMIEILNLIDNLRKQIEKNSKAILLISNFLVPYFSQFGILDLKKQGIRSFVRHLNLEFEKRLSQSNQTYIFDFENIGSAFGKRNVVDLTKYYRGSFIFHDELLPLISNELIGYVKALKNLNKKCIVLDLDNTLWGGIVGEDGIDGIKLNQNHPGKEFYEFQKLLLSYYHRGIILAINSKNNFDDAIEVIRDHPAMVLRENNFAIMKINWQDKVQNILEIASELNIGVDSLVFLDDNPVERARVQSALPDVLVPEMPKNPSLYKHFLKDLNDFSTFSLSKEDLNRGEMYVARRKRQALEMTYDSMDSFLNKLAIKVAIRRLDKFSQPRIVSLINRTNQFNLTTTRFTENEIGDLINAGQVDVFSLQVSDKFGDEGVVGVVMLEKQNEVWSITNFLMSCRVIGRKIEILLLNQIIKSAKRAAIPLIQATYIPSKKNILVKDFYADHGFSKIDETNGITKWELNPAKYTGEDPDFIEVKKNEL